ncbi:MAG: hypothetical protein WC568_01135 [Candidatus Methanoperedens sp.]
MRGIPLRLIKLSQSFTQIRTDSVSVKLRPIRVHPCSTSGAVHRKGRKERKVKAAEGIRKKSSALILRS